MYRDSIDLAEEKHKHKAGDNTLAFLNNMEEAFKCLTLVFIRVKRES